ncbi:MAG: hypothetical protein ACYTGR_13005 [Planctomycetota bacterium]|jgi:hypothetical protein
MRRTSSIVILLSGTLAGCATMPARVVNPSAPGFLASESDAVAIDMADSVMERMGGRAAWDGTRYIRWNFFGARSHVWDRQTGMVRIEGRRREDGAAYTVIMDLDDDAGRAWIDGREVLDDQERRDLLRSGRSAWINDSYWLVMPYKLKDTGVRLRHLGPGEMADGRPADVLELTFREVGDTPDNKYHVYVATRTGLVEQWDFYRDADDPEPAFQIPWRGWTRHGSILLSGDRGDREITEIAVFESLPEGVFESADAVNWSSLE